MVVDTDGGSDDAVALLLALRSPGVRVEAVTTVAGNVPVGQTTNVLRTLDVVRSSVPVYAGADAPLSRPWERGSAKHGADGLGDAGLPPPLGDAAPGSAVDTLLDARPGATLVTLGPLTNVAHALERDRRLLERFDAVVCMLGRADGSEFNARADPEAAQAVLSAPGPPRVLLGKDVSERDGVVATAQREALHALQTAESEFVLRVTDRAARAAGGAHDLPDALAMAVALDPGLVQTHELCCVRVGTRADERSWLLPDDGAPNVRVVTSADGDAFRARLAAACAG
nr:nucleoside hydrolase [Motilibacter deserti]